MSLSRRSKMGINCGHRGGTKMGINNRTIVNFSNNHGSSSVDRRFSEATYITYNLQQIAPLGDQSQEFPLMKHKMQ
jgi:hypothetical protein